MLNNGAVNNYLIDKLGLTKTQCRIIVALFSYMNNDN